MSRTYANKKCENCGKEFSPSGSRVTWCDDCCSVSCHNCGVDFKVTRFRIEQDTAKFCKGCGTKLEKGEVTAPPPTETAAPSPRPITSQRVLSVAETGEVLEKVDREADEEGIHILSNTFAETLTQLARSREELARIEERVADALRIQREKEEKACGRQRRGQSKSSKQYRLGYSMYEFVE